MVGEREAEQVDIDCMLRDSFKKGTTLNNYLKFTADTGTYASDLFLSFAIACGV